MFQIEFGNPAKRFLRKCDKNLYERLMSDVRALAINPFPQGVVRVVGRKEKIFRIRVGDYRIQYLVFHEKNLIFITDADKRPRAYD